MSDKTQRVEVGGKWQVKGGVLIEEITRSSHPTVAPVGRVTRDTLLSVGEHEYRYRTEKGKENVRLRSSSKSLK